MPVEFLYISTLIAIFSVVFSCILMDEDMIFGFWGRVVNRLPEWLGNPLGGCIYCMSGQIALWGYFALEKYHPVHHIFFISTTIFITHIIYYIYGKAI